MQASADQCPTTAARLAPPSWRARTFALGLALAMLAPLVVGAALRPDVRGVETHTQLGLPPCGWMLRYGRPCATCGMTTSVSLASHGRLLSAFRVQPLGALMAIACSAGFWTGLFGFVTGVRLGVWCQRICQPWMVMVFVGCLLASWAYKLVTWEAHSVP